MSETLDRQLEAYRRLLPEIRSSHVPGWALIANEKLVRVFPEFDEAARYADAHFAEQQVLIRHTAEQRGTIPFIVSGRDA